ncbi:MAG: hypothetical protein ACR2O4_18060 [Hyphomicrobiaceae bacterium]
MTDAHQSDSGRTYSRVVLQSRTAAPNRLALESAIHLARALRSHIQNIFIEDQNLLTLADLPFAAEISTTGRRVPIADFAAMEKKMRLASAAVRQRLDRLARRNAVVCEYMTVRGEVSQALTPYCSEHCFIVMAETFDTSDMAGLRHLFESPAGLGGALLVGPQAQARTGPVIVVVENQTSSEELIRVAGHVARERQLDEIVILATRDHLTDTQIREALENSAAGLVRRIVRPKHGLNFLQSVVQAVRDLNGSIVIASRSNRLQPGEGELHGLVNSLSAPLLLVR